MKPLSIRFAIVALLVASSTALAEPANRRNPYSNLFTAQVPGVPGRPPAPVPQLPPLTTVVPTPTSKVVCGLVVWQGDAKIDSRMSQHVPPGAAAGTIRVVEPQICR